MYESNNNGYPKDIISYVKLYALISMLTISCHPLGDNDTFVLIECPGTIAKKALSYAIEYSHKDTQYEYGGQDYLRAIKIDCSGLVVNCYMYAIVNTEYFLPFTDAAVIDFYKKWTVKTNIPRPGDLIFMGDNENMPTHISICVKINDNNIYFIDSTFKPEEGIDGVSERFYRKDDPRFLSFGVLLLGIKYSSSSLNLSLPVRIRHTRGQDFYMRG
jgi:hypothetical protein